MAEFNENDPKQIWHKLLVIDGEEINFFLTKEVLKDTTDEELIKAYKKSKNQNK